MASTLSTIRVAALGSVALFSLIVLGVAAHVTNLTTYNFGFYFTFAALSIATAVLSLLSLPVMIIVDKMRKGAFTSMIAVELGWLSFLWILWLSSAATASQASSGFNRGCRYRSGLISTTCREFRAIQAFNYLNWIILFGYTGALLAFAIGAANRGIAAWTASVKAVESGEVSAIPQVTPQPTGPAVVPQMQQPLGTGVSQAPTMQIPVPHTAPVTPASGWTGQPQNPSTPGSPVIQV